MIQKIIPSTVTNITLLYSAKQYLCYAPVLTVGAVFQLGSATVVPTSTDESSFVYDVEVLLNDQNPCIIDDNGNVYMEVSWYKQNFGTTPPSRVP